MLAAPPDPGQKLVKIGLSSRLALDYRDELERIVFFNPDQDRIRDPLAAAVRRFGVPRIVEDGNVLRFQLPSLGAIQSLYAFDERPMPIRLVGVVMFVRKHDDPSTILVIHLAVHEDFAANGPHANAWVGSRLLSMVHGISRRTRGITTIEVLYPNGHRIPVR